MIPNQKEDFAWIHLEQLPFFLYLGANEYEQKIGQNIKIDLSLCIKYVGTKDILKNTIDYGCVFESLTKKIQSLTSIHLLEYLAEELLTHIEKTFRTIYAAKIIIQKGFVPLVNFHGTVKIEAEKLFAHKELPSL